MSSGAKLQLVLGLILFSAGICSAQFTSNVQGIVQDPSGAVVPKATVTLVNVGTQVTRTTTTDENGNYRFVSLAPGAYKITVEASGYAKSESNVTLLTEQNLNVPITMKVGAVTEAVIVTSTSPLVDTADSRNQLTLENSGVGQLPIQGRNLVTLTTLAPGVSGLWTVSYGSPGSAPDNYSTETQVDASANGQGQNSNMYVIDGLDVTSSIRQGVLNLTPNPESIQEATVQVNTYSAEYNRGTGVQEVMTTKSGTDSYHGSAADWFNYQNWWAKTHFTDPKGYQAFHQNNMSFTFGGPIIPHKQFFGYFALEPLRASYANTGLVTFPSDAFVAFAQTNFPNTIGTHLLTTYRPSNVTTLSTDASTGISTGNYSATQVRNGTQYFLRIDKVFSKDRIYGSFYRTVLETGAPSPMPAFSALNHNWQRAIQVNWNHTFSPTTMNEFMFGGNRIEGVLGTGAKDYTVPSVSVNGINVDSNQAFGVGFAQGDFIQHNYHWRDVLTHVRGAHTLKFGYEGWFGDDVEPFQGPWSQPKFVFNTLLDLAQDQPANENGVMYDPVKGQPILWSWDAASKTWGLFAEDTWKARRNLTLTLGFRWDDEGNPYQRSPSTVFGNFYFGAGQTLQEQIANGFAKPTHHALNHTVNNLLSPRGGFAWDVLSNGNTVLRGGIGLFNNWLTSANVQEEFRGSPPGPVLPTFGSTDPVPPLFVLGTGSKPPFGFTYPALAGSAFCPALGPDGCLDSHGGIPGAHLGIGGIDPNIKSPKAAIWSLTLEQKIATNYSAAVGYSGSHSYNLVSGGSTLGQVSYGQDINAFAGDLIVNPSPVRLNPSFGSIAYTQNNRYGNYEGVFFEFKGRFSQRSFFDASYTRSRSKDDANVFPAEADPATYYGLSNWDVPNRFSLTLNYQVPGLNGGQGLAGRLTEGWGLSGTTVFQSGYPVMVFTDAGFLGVCQDGSLSNVPPGCSASNPVVAFQPGSGDFNADGDNLDYPDVSSYHQGNSKAAFLNGALSRSQFTVPALGTEGNEKVTPFRGPNFFESDVNVYKDTHLGERLVFQLRFEFFNIFNRVNLLNFQNNLNSGAFGKAANQALPRYWQVGGRISF